VGVEAVSPLLSPVAPLPTEAVVAWAAVRSVVGLLAIPVLFVVDAPAGSAAALLVVVLCAEVVSPDAAPPVLCAAAASRVVELLSSLDVPAGAVTCGAVASAAAPPVVWVSDEVAGAPAVIPGAGVVAPGAEWAAEPADGSAAAAEPEAGLVPLPCSNAVTLSEVAGVAPLADPPRSPSGAAALAVPFCSPAGRVVSSALGWVLASAVVGGAAVAAAVWLSVVVGFGPAAP
jgi:hypothetical protein